MLEGEQVIVGVTTVGNGSPGNLLASVRFGLRKPLLRTHVKKLTVRIRRAGGGATRKEKRVGTKKTKMDERVGKR